LDSSVHDWLEKHEIVDQMRADIEKFLLYWLPQFSDSQRSYITVGIGCTGGRHRSVYLVTRLSAKLRDKFAHVMTHHRELQT
jgi:UPF0042 nucleotide-binding protein